MKRWLPVVIIPLLILMSPVPGDLKPLAWKLFAVYVGAILGLVLRPASEAMVLLFVIAFGSFFVPLGQLLSGYASTNTWLVFTAFLISQSFSDTGLGKRIAYMLTKRFGKSSLGLAYGMAFTDLIISPATPSSTARACGIVYPIYTSVCQTLGSVPGETARKLGSYITLSLYQINLTTSAMFVTASAPNILLCTLAKDILKVQISWLDWAIAAFVPGMVMLLLCPIVVYKLYPPTMEKLENAEEFAQKGLDEIGPITTKEKYLVVLFILAILAWATGTVTKVDATTVALIFFVASVLLKLISFDNVLANKSAWSTLLWYGGIIGISGALANAGFFVWLAGVMKANMNLTGFNPVLVLGILSLIGLAIRYLFASYSAYVAAFVPVIYTLGVTAEVPAGALAYFTTMTVVYGCMLTHYGAGVAPGLFGPGYVEQKDWWRVGAIMAILATVVYLAVGLPYWKILGLW